MLSQPRNQWVWGGTIEDHVRLTKGSKGGTTSRELRTLTHNGIVIDSKYYLLDKHLEYYGETKKKAVQYKLVEIPKVEIDRVAEEQKKQLELL